MRVLSPRLVSYGVGFPASSNFLLQEVIDNLLGMSVG